MIVGCSSTAFRQAGKHTRGNRRADALANVKDLQPCHPECEELQSSGTRNIPNMKSYNHAEPENIPNMKRYNHAEPETSRMRRATTVWHPNIPNVNSYRRVAPETSRI